MVTFTALGLVSVMASPAAGASPASPIPVEHPTPAPISPHGFVEMIGDAIAEVSLRADQETAVEALGADIEPLQARVDDAENALLLALAEQVKGGRIDAQAIEPRICAYANTRRAVSTGLRIALERLHAILDADQRSDFVDELECVVHDVTRMVVTGELLDDFTKKLGLNEAQKQQVHADFGQLVPELKAERRHIHRAVEAFRCDTFSIEQFLPQAEVANKARKRAERIVDLTGSILRVLDAEQRAKLAARIEEAARARSELPEEAAPPGPEPVHPMACEEVGTAAQLWWAGRAVRGPLGGYRGVVVAGSPRYYYGRVGAYPVAAGLGWGW
jgi:Spy/CpxP family protein refolding chaperone